MHAPAIRLGLIIFLPSTLTNNEDNSGLCFVKRLFGRVHTRLLWAAVWSG